MWDKVRRWLDALPLSDPIERRQALLVQVILLGLSGLFFLAALLTLVAYPFTTGAMAAGNLANTIANTRSLILVLIPLALLRRGAFRAAVVILMLELFTLAFRTTYSMGLERGWLGVFEFSLPISLAALVLGRRWLLGMFLASIAGVGLTAFAWYPLAALPQNAPSASISFIMIAGLLAVFLDRFGTAFRQSLTALADNNSLLSAVIEGTPDAVYVKDRRGRYLMINAAGAHRYGLAPADVIDKDDTALVGSAVAERIRVIDQRIMERGEGESYEDTPMVHGTARSYLVTTVPYRDQHDTIVGTLGISRDVTEYKRLEAQLLQSQKMESIGQLAGGIAHDFNNMLSAVIGFIGSAQEELPQDSPVQRDLQTAESAAWRAAGLTRQLLAFARKQIVEPHVLNLNEVIVEMDKLLRRLIGEDIELVTLPAAGLGQVKADPGQIEQVIANLVVNARDAMPQGGRLTIETANTVLDDRYARQHVGAIPGEYVMLAISDTGIGMDTEVQQHIFEPFYTTKEVGKGTGLGLATCYGIVKQHLGNIWVYSEPGHGTTFKVYLPRVYEAAERSTRQSDAAPLPRGTETVLLVEDEPLVREIACQILRELGYAVIEAGNGDEALRIIHTSPNLPIALLVTDVVMPQIGGKALAELVTAAHPKIKVLFVSGYAADAIVHHGRLEPGTNFLSKPFTPATLARKVREVLDA